MVTYSSVTSSLVERAVAARNRCYKDTIMSNFFEQAIDRGDDSGGGEGDDDRQGGGGGREGRGGDASSQRGSGRLRDAVKGKGGGNVEKLSREAARLQQTYLKN